MNQVIKADKQELILIAAEKLFAENGFDATTTRMLAREAGVNLAMISYYYGSKEKLFEALVEKRAGAFRQEIEQVNTQIVEPFKKVEHIIGMYADKIFDNNNFHRILMRELSLKQRSMMNDAIVEILLRNTFALRNTILEGIKSGHFRKDVDAELTVASMIGTVSQFTSSSYLSLRLVGGDPDRETIFDEKYKKRIKKHLSSLLRAYLLNV